MLFLCCFSLCHGLNRPSLISLFHFTKRWISISILSIICCTLSKSSPLNPLNAKLWIFSSLFIWQRFFFMLLRILKRFYVLKEKLVIWDLISGHTHLYDLHIFLSFFNCLFKKDFLIILLPIGEKNTSLAIMNTQWKIVNHPNSHKWQGHFTGKI